MVVGCYLKGEENEKGRWGKREGFIHLVHTTNVY